MDENITSEASERSPLSGSLKKEKNPKRVAAGKKGIEAKKLKAELKRKEAEQLKKENLELKLANERSREVPLFNEQQPYQITSFKPEVSEGTEKSTFSASDCSNKNYIPILLLVGAIGLGVYYEYNKRKQTVQKPIVVEKKKEIDPFEF